MSSSQYSGPAQVEQHIGTSPPLPGYSGSPHVHLLHLHAF